MEQNIKINFGSVTVKNPGQGANYSIQQHMTFGNSGQMEFGNSGTQCQCVLADKLEEEEEIEEEEESEEEEDEEEKIELHYGSVTVKNAPAGANYRFQKQTDFQPQAVASWTQPNQTPPQSSTPQNNASLFQVSHNLEFQGGGSFSLGSSGVCYKSGRII